jgi:hypothetical protein
MQRPRERPERGGAPREKGMGGRSQRAAEERDQQRVGRDRAERVNADAR